MVCHTPELDQDFLEGVLKWLSNESHSEKPVERYLRIQRLAGENKSFSTPERRRIFNAYYRVRRGREWQEQFYALFPEVRQKFNDKKDRIETFAWALGTLRQRLLENGLPQRIEASFVSKLVATYDEDAAIIDSRVLRHFGIRLSYGAINQ